MQNITESKLKISSLPRKHCADNHLYVKFKKIHGILIEKLCDNLLLTPHRNSNLSVLRFSSKPGFLKHTSTDYCKHKAMFFLASRNAIHSNKLIENELKSLILVKNRKNTLLPFLVIKRTVFHFVSKYVKS